MKKFDEEYKKWLGQLDPFDKNNWKYLKDRPLPQMKLDLPLELVTEDRHLDVNVGQKALGYLKSCLAKDHPVQVDIEKLKFEILSSWKYYADFFILCEGEQLWVAKTDFNEVERADELVRQVCPEFNEKFGKNNGSYGLTISLPDGKCLLLMDNEAAKDDKKIMHEFTHFVQMVTGKIKLDKSTELDKVKACFKVGKEYADYIFHEYEFWTHMYVDLFNGLQRIYWERFKDYAWEEFIDSQFSIFLKELTSIETSQLASLWKKTFGGNNLSIFKVLAAIGFANKPFYDEIVEKLKNKEMDRR